MKKLLLLTDALPQGGAERQLVNLAIGLKKRGHNVRLITFYPEANFYAADMKDACIQEECIHNGKNGFKRAIVIRSLVKKWRPDFVVCYKSGSSMAACIARMVCKFNLVVSERNTNQNISRKDRIKFFLYRWADHIVPNSYSQAEFIKKYFPSLYSRVKVITNMVDTEKFKPFTKKYNNEITQVITTARVTHQKNLFNYLKTVRILKEKGVKVHFNWYGRVDGSKEYWDEVKNKMNEMEIEDYLTFHGPTRDPVRAYNSSDIFLLPSFYEGFPNVLCEAMACELPCIATNVCDSPLILRDQRWWADPYNPEDMADKIQEMSSLSKEEREKIGKRNRERIVSLCSEEEFINRYLELA